MSEALALSGDIREVNFWPSLQADAICRYSSCGTRGWRFRQKDLPDIETLVGKSRSRWSQKGCANVSRCLQGRAVRRYILGLRVHSDPNLEQAQVPLHALPKQRSRMSDIPLQLCSTARC